MKLANAVLAVKCFVKSTNMSRVGKQILEIPSGTTVSFADRVVTVKNDKATMSQIIPVGVTVNVADNQVTVTVDNETDKQMKMSWGTTTSLIKNMIKGLTEGFKKELEVNGVGFKANISGKKLNLSLGFSHPIEFDIPKEIEASIEKNVITIQGYDKQMVGQVAAQIRALKKPEPYKGKGIKYVDEVIRRKAGKAAAGSEK